MDIFIPTLSTVCLTPVLLNLLSMMSTCMIKALQIKVYLINNTIKDMLKKKMYMASPQKDSANIYLPFTSLDLSCHLQILINKMFVPL